MMKWRVRKENRCISDEHEDVRQSLEVLDSVLAEFDDCLDAWDALCDNPDGYDPGCVLTEKLGNLSPTYSYDNQSTDGDTSHDSGLSLQEQVKFSPPPPIPKRSAKTKLSHREGGNFNFDFTDSRSSDSLDNDLSETSGLSPKDNNNSENRAIYHPKCDSDSSLLNVTQAMGDQDVSSSPFSERRKLFEDMVACKPLMERSFTGSSFKGRPEGPKDCESEPSSLSLFRSLDIDREDSSPPSFESRHQSRATRVTPPRVDGLLSLPGSQYHAPNCTCKERILQLQERFAGTVRLLKAGKIQRLRQEPPSFVPPPPPPPAESSPKTAVLKGSLAKASPKISPISRSYKDLRTAGSPASASSEDSSLSFNRQAEQGLSKRSSLSSDHLPLAETIEDLPKLLPTDVLVRPQLGLSYSMEDDLSPGVKEISPPPRSSTSLESSRKSKSSSLSTFHLSAADSSLGYASSQSERDSSLSPKKQEKVPVSALKFNTLPEGVDLHSLPSYYGQLEGPEAGKKQALFLDRNFNHTSNPQLRSTSVPPEPPKPKKGGIFRGFSRKIKKDKEKNSDLLRSKVS